MDGSALINLLIVSAPNLVGFVLPPLVELLNKDIQNENERYLIALVVCIAVGTFLHWGDIANGHPEQMAAYTAIIFAESNSIFKLYFANSWIRGKIQEKLGNSNDENEVLSPANVAHVE